MENEKLIEEVSMLKKEIYDLKNSHVHLIIEEDTNDEGEEHEDDFEIRDDMSPYEQMSISKKHIRCLWENRKSNTEYEEWPFVINDDMSNLEITRRKEALKLYEDRIEEEIRDIAIDDNIYLTDGLMVVEVNEEQELGDIIGYIDPSISENEGEQVIFFN